MKALRTDPTGRRSMQLSIHEVAERLAERKRELERRKAALGSGIRARLASPDMFLIAVGAGFMFGLHTDRRRVVTAPVATQPVRAATPAKDHLFLKFALELLVRAFASATAAPQPPAPADRVEPGPAATENPDGDVARTAR
jgi:hypothetical protein